MTTKSTANAGVTTNEWGEKLDVSASSKYVKTSALENGQSIEGTILAFQDSERYPGTLSLVMRMPTGETKTVQPSGTIKKAIQQGKLKIGHTYKFVREGSEKIKGLTSGVFGIYPSKRNAGSNDSNTADI